MVNFIKRLKAFPSFVKLSYNLMKFAFYLGNASDYKARQMIIQVRWLINQHEDEEIKKHLLDFVNEMEKTRFKNGQDNI